ncbi:hypothetical protein [Pseudorhodobacter wandonensis]|uniref:hypothetical protein n=1 Tax=Pseudorhodobacter wandonensis TaxID=1120568 RepID=UPI00067CC5E7|nr:hypothetical protein [Pseudorhodobacter wandonensis]
MSNVQKLPTAAISFYTVNKAGRNFDVVLVTPCPGKDLKTRLRRWSDREAAIADAKATADTMKRPFKMRGAAA